MQTLHSNKKNIVLTVFVIYAVFVFHLFLFFYSRALALTSITVLFIAVITGLLLSTFPLPISNRKVILKTTLMVLIFTLIASLLSFIGERVYEFYVTRISKEGALEGFSIVVFIAIIFQQLLSWHYLIKFKRKSMVSNWVLLPAAILSVISIIFIPFGLIMIIAIIRIIFLT